LVKYTPPKEPVIIQPTVEYKPEKQDYGSYHPPKGVERGLTPAAEQKFFPETGLEENVRLIDSRELPVLEQAQGKISLGTVAMCDRYMVNNLEDAGYDVHDTATGYEFRHYGENYEPAVEEKFWMGALTREPITGPDDYGARVSSEAGGTLFQVDKIGGLQGIMITDSGIKEQNLQGVRPGPGSGFVGEPGGGQGECCVFNPHGGGGCGPCGGGPQGGSAFRFRKEMWPDSAVDDLLIASIEITSQL
jgi:hypothetical protein